MSNSSEKKLHINWLQWVVLIISLLIIAAIVAYLGYAIYRHEDAPPNLEITTTYQGDGIEYIYEVRLTNTGDQPAQNVALEYALYQEGKEAETGTMTFAYAPVMSEKVGWIHFRTTRKPGDSLEITSVSYVKP
jgi:uncharacterized protein (TIGR02588 family)